MKNKTNRILLIASWYPSEENPLSGIFIQEQAQNLANFGHEVTIVHPFLTGTFLKTLSEKSKSVSITKEKTGKVIRVGVSPVLPGARKLAYSKLLGAIESTLREENISQDSFNIIHSHSSFMAGYIGLKLNKKWNIPWVHTEHSSSLIFDTNQFNKADESIINKIFTQANKVIFVSQFARSEFLEQWNIEQTNRHVVVGNVVHDLFYNKELSSPNDPLSFLIIGNILHVKKHSTLIKAWTEFSKTNPTCRLTILGDDTSNSNFDTLVSDLASVQRLPSTGREELAEIINKHHIVLSTSHVETFGLSIAEAQALGKPVLVTDSGGVNDIVTKETGIITGRTSGEFKVGLEQITRDYKKFIPSKIREASKVKFSKEIIVNKLNGIYSSLFES